MTLRKHLISEQQNAQHSDSNTGVISVWSTKRPSVKDSKATEIFLELRQKYAHEFDDKKHVKTQLWGKIAREMYALGFDVGTGRDAVEKLRQKFSNLQKQYMKHVSHMKRTGEEKKEPPPFFSEMHGIMSNKHKSDPKNLQDTLEACSSSSVQESETDDLLAPQSPSSCDQEKKEMIKNRFSLNKIRKPSTSNVQLINLMQTQHEDDRTERREQFNRLENLLQQQNEQRERLLNTFDSLIRQKKRKHNSDSDSD